jgi:hypothetical protein
VAGVQACVFRVRLRMGLIEGGDGQRGGIRVFADEGQLSLASPASLFHVYIACWDYGKWEWQTSLMSRLS